MPPLRKERAKMGHPAVALVAGFVFLSTALFAQQLPSGRLDNFAGHPRAFIVSDIGNEPDDQMSFVRLLLYSNEIDLEGLVATTSTWQKSATHPETMHEIIAKYGEVRPNLLKHAPGWPTAADLDRLVSTGQPAYGMAAVGPGKSSPGAQALVKAADRDDSEAVMDHHLGRCQYAGSGVARCSRHTFAGGAGEDLWPGFASTRFPIRMTPDHGSAKNFRICFMLSVHHPPNSGEYYYATWTGISGDVYYRNGEGADFSTVTNEWLDANIRGKGPMGKQYPRFAFIMEGDTPSFLGLIDNGLASWWNPGWGGWGGRYIFRQPYGETHAIWTQGGDLFRARDFAGHCDRASTARATLPTRRPIWRWREAFQHDFAARMDWTIKPFAEANHNPVVVVNGQAGTAPIFVDAVVGQPVVLDASQSRDPDGQTLHYSWFHYARRDSGDGRGLAAVNIADAESSKANDHRTATCRPMWIQIPGAKCPAQGVAHIILSVTDNGSPSLTSYRRVVLNVRAAP